MRGISGFYRWRRAPGAGVRAVVTVACAVLALAGCDAIPSSGPLVKEVVDESQAATR